MNTSAIGAPFFLAQFPREFELRPIAQNHSRSLTSRRKRVREERCDSRPCFPFVSIFNGTRDCRKPRSPLAF